VDDLLPDVLQFPAGTDLHDHPLVADGRLILQARPPRAGARRVRACCAGAVCRGARGCAGRRARGAAAAACGC